LKSLATIYNYTSLNKYQFFFVVKVLGSFCLAVIKIESSRPIQFH